MRLFVTFLVLFMSSVAFAQGGGAACAMAKYKGQTFEYVLVYGKSHPFIAQEEAKKQLRAKGYGNYLNRLDIVHHQNLSNLKHAYVIIIRSEFKDNFDREKSVVGCGFSAISYQDAQWQAIRDAQQYYWGWKPDRDGFSVIERLRY